MRIQWTKALSVGIGQIDEQHQELFRRADRLRDALRSGRLAEVEEVLAFLREYAETHFALEERWMREHAFAGYLRHKAQHDRFVSDLRAISKDFADPGARAFVTLRVSHWLARWLEEHVSGVDRELGAFLAKRTA